MTTAIIRKAGTTDVSVVIRIIDSGDGTPETGVTSATSGIDLEYRREGAAVVNITEADLSALTDAHSDGGMLHISGGYYRLDLPDAACASGATGVLVAGTITGMVVIGCYVQLVAYDPFDTVRLGLTALPNAAADAAGGLPISDAGGLDLDAQLVTKINDILTDTGTTLQAEVDGIQADTEDIQSRLPAALTAGGNIKADILALNGGTQSAADLKDFADDGYDPSTNKVQGVVLTDTLTTYTGNTPQTGDSFARLGAPAGASVSADILAVDNLVDDLESRIGTPSDLGGGATVSANLADIEAQTDDIGAAGAGLTALATQASVNTIDDFLDTEIAAIKAKTDNLPTDPADQSAVEAAILAAWTTALTESYNADGSPPTPAQALFVIMQRLTEFSKSGATITAKKLDGTTTAFTLTLDDATDPTSSTRAT